MSAAMASSLKLSAMAELTCFLTVPSLFNSPSKPPCLLLPPRPLRFRLSSSASSRAVALESRIRFPSFATFVAQTSDWAQQEGDSTITIDGQETETEAEEDEPTWENQESDGAEASLSDWEGEGEDAGTEEESGVVEETEEEFSEPPEDAKLFVGNLPYDVDSQSLAMLFEKAGTVEIAEVIYNRETDQSRGFGFVTMSTVEEAEKAAELLNGHDINGRLLTVNKASPRGSRVERPPRSFEPSFRIYVGNLPWDVDNGRLEQVFSEHGKVVEARVVYDRESGRSRGFGFVTMASETELNDAIAAMDGQTMDGRALRVNVAEQRPRRSF